MLKQAVCLAWVGLALADSLGTCSNNQFSVSTFNTIHSTWTDWQTTQTMFLDANNPTNQVQITINSLPSGYKCSSCGIYAYLFFDDQVKNHTFDASGQWVPGAPQSSSSIGVTCDNIALHYGCGDVGISQNITCSALGIYGAGTTMTVYIPMMIIYANEDGSSSWCTTTISTMLYIRASLSPSTSSGDPHFWHSRGTYVDYQDLGWMWYLRSSYYGVFVQVRQYSCNNLVTCQDTMVVQYENEIVIVAPWNAYLYQGSPIVKLYNNTPSANEPDHIQILTYGAPGTSGWQVQLQFDNGMVMTVGSYKWFCQSSTFCSWYFTNTYQYPAKYYFNQKTSTVPYFGGFVGCLDNVNTNSFPVNQKEWRLPYQPFGAPNITAPPNPVTDGWYFESYGVLFGESWRVHAADILMDRCLPPNNPIGCGFTTRRSDQNIKFYNPRPWPYKIPSGFVNMTGQVATAKNMGSSVTFTAGGVPCSGINRAQAPPVDSNRFNLPSFTQPSQMHPARLGRQRRDGDANQMAVLTNDPKYGNGSAFSNDALALCNVAINNTACPLMQADIAVTGCWKDALMSQSFDLIDTHRASFMTRCAHVINNLNAHDPDNPDTADDDGDDDAATNETDGATTRRRDRRDLLDRRSPHRPNTADHDNHVLTRPSGKIFNVTQLLSMAKQVSKDIGLGNNNCTGCVHGDCTALGCICFQGWTGHSCNVDVNAIAAKHGKKVRGHRQYGCRGKCKAKKGHGHKKPKKTKVVKKTTGTKKSLRDDEEMEERDGFVVDPEDEDHQHLVARDHEEDFWHDSVREDGSEDEYWHAPPLRRDWYEEEEEDGGEEKQMHVHAPRDGNNEGPILKRKRRSVHEEL
ncbi:hypothetical protein BC830DRAFT_1150160 [Chytriomyces sp. MP71]|nr:hypothetical protein BC830DRAFT_1150160 [Chytriomyces sp. MP71]